MSSALVKSFAMRLSYPVVTPECSGNSQNSNKMYFRVTGVRKMVPLSKLFCLKI